MVSAPFLPALGRYRFSRQLITSLRKRVARLTRPHGYRVTQAQGAAFLTNYRNFVDRQIDFWGDYEHEQLQFFCARLAHLSCEVFVDVGANLGYYTVLIARRFPSLRVVAFEPDRRNWAQLHANLLINGLLTRVETHPVALTARPGNLPFEAYPDSSSGQSRVSASASVEVRGVRLDDVMPPTTRPIALKIDIEGHELAALQGMTTLLRQSVVLVQVEAFPDSLPAVRTLLHEHGFAAVHRIGDDHFFEKS